MHLKRQDMSIVIIMSYQFKVTLEGVDPPIWRRFKVPKTLSLNDFSYVIQDVMQWFGTYYYRFILEKSILIPDYEAEDSVDELLDIPLESIIHCEHIQFEYALDDNHEGKGWMHRIEFEGESSEKLTKPICIEGERGCPPDDLDGCADAYPAFLEIVMNKDHPDREKVLFYNFKDDTFDSEKFDPSSLKKYRKGGPIGTKFDYYE